jgi:hypothetical protein
MVLGCTTPTEMKTKRNNAKENMLFCYHGSAFLVGIVDSFMQINSTMGTHCGISVATVFN